MEQSLRLYSKQNARDEVSSYLLYRHAHPVGLLLRGSPKLNGGVERVHRTHTEEFYKVTESSFDIAELGKELLEWERIYNTVRPHQALGYLTPSVFLEQQKYHQRREVMRH